VIEDAHWADEATMDLLRSLAMRVMDTGALVLVTYRSDEVGPDHPLAVLLGDLATSPAMCVNEVPPLSVGAVQALIDDTELDIDAIDLHERTSGNAFHVTEVLASGGADVPVSVRDAVRARVARLAPDSRRALDVVALAGLRAEPELIADVLGDQADAADEAVRQGVLLATGEGLTFRHDLARRAVADDVPPMRRIALHRAILHSLQRHPELADPSRIAHHAEAARERSVALSAAMEAGRCSAELGAHREAVLQYERALRVVPTDDPRRLEIVEGHSYELYLTGRIDDSITQRAEALQIYQARDDRLALATTHRWMSRLHWFSGHGAAAEEHGQRAAALLPPGEDSAEAAMVLSNLSQLRMLSGDVDGTMEWGKRAVSMARAVGADNVEVHAMINMGSIDRVKTGLGPGSALLEEALDRALAGGMEEHAARAYCNLVSGAIDVRQLDQAESWVLPGIEYCRDRDSWGFYLEGLLGQLRLCQGRLVDAQQVADRVLRRPHTPAINRIDALLTSGLARARMGDFSMVADVAEGLAVALESGERQRIALAASAMMELAWLRGEPAPEPPQRLYEPLGSREIIREMGELACWTRGSARPIPVPDDIIEPYALLLDGRPDEAAQAWAELGCSYDQGLALGMSDDVERVAEGVRILNDLGAFGATTRLGVRLNAMGGRVPRPRRTATRQHPGGLTEREAEVLDLLADGASNADIASALGISARTAEHHVSAVLGKLGTSTRVDAVVLAADRGWVGIGTGTPQDR
jgi:DNA-binding CsgD family transcriptional regulator/tetratricopeptide (TPR) repeat protein